MLQCSEVFTRLADGLWFATQRRGPFMNRSKEHRQQLEQLFHELRAINAWDRDFFLAKEPSLLEFDAWEARRLRVLQIFHEFSQALNRSPSRDQK